MLLVVELTLKDAAATEQAAGLLDDYLESLLASGLAKYRIAREIAPGTSLVLLEEWASSAAHDASQQNNAAFATMQAELAPLLAEPPRAHEYEIVAAGVAAE